MTKKKLLFLLLIRKPFKRAATCTLTTMTLESQRRLYPQEGLLDFAGGSNTVSTNDALESKESTAASELLLSALSKPILLMMESTLEVAPSINLE